MDTEIIADAQAMFEHYLHATPSSSFQRVFPQAKDYLYPEPTIQADTGALAPGAHRVLRRGSERVAVVHSRVAPRGVHELLGVTEILRPLIEQGFAVDEEILPVR
jgi:hypothetical protein